MRIEYLFALLTCAHLSVLFVDGTSNLTVGNITGSKDDEDSEYNTSFVLFNETGIEVPNPYFAKSIIREHLKTFTAGLPTKRRGKKITRKVRRRPSQKNILADKTEKVVDLDYFISWTKDAHYAEMLETRQKNCPYNKTVDPKDEDKTKEAKKKLDELLSKYNNDLQKLNDMVRVGDKSKSTKKNQLKTPPAYTNVLFAEFQQIKKNLEKTTIMDVEAIVFRITEYFFLLNNSTEGSLNWKNLCNIGAILDRGEILSSTSDMRSFILLLERDDGISWINSEDFTKLLHLNLIIRLILEHDDLKILETIYTPKHIIANVVITPDDCKRYEYIQNAYRMPPNKPKVIPYSPSNVMTISEPQYYSLLLFFFDQAPRLETDKPDTLGNQVITTGLTEYPQYLDHFEEPSLQNEAIMKRVVKYMDDVQEFLKKRETDKTEEAKKEKITRNKLEKESLDVAVWISIGLITLFILCSSFEMFMRIYKFRTVFADGEKPSKKKTGWIPFIIIPKKSNENSLPGKTKPSLPVLVKESDDGSTTMTLPMSSLFFKPKNETKDDEKYCSNA